MAYRVTAMLAIAATLGPTALALGDPSCPQSLREARRLVLVTAGSMKTSAASVQLFQRSAPEDRWRRVGGPVTASLGSAGMAWGYGFHGLRRRGEAIKVEGDKRTPAGIYPLGRSFGFTASERRRHLRLTRQTVCVDDVRSPAYNTITSRRAVAPGIHVEEMYASRNYRQGLFVDYPTHAAARAGSCIFIHVWRSPRYPTSGCIALSEARVRALQDFAEAGAVLAVLPRAGVRQLSGCLPRSGR